MYEKIENSSKSSYVETPVKNRKFLNCLLNKTKFCTCCKLISSCCCSLCQKLLCPCMCFDRWHFFFHLLTYALGWQSFTLACFHPYSHSLLLLPDLQKCTQNCLLAPCEFSVQTCYIVGLFTFASNAKILLELHLKYCGLSFCHYKYI